MKPHLKLLKPYRGTESHSHELLILNESFYIENRSEEVDPVEWYKKGTNLLTECERGYVNYESIFKHNKLPDGRWKNRGCTIYRTLESTLAAAGYPKIFNMLNHCTLANCFLRPALNGDSLKIQEIDRKFAKDYLIEITGQLNPKLIICASSKAYHSVVKHIKFKQPVVQTVHPTCAWWNRNEGSYGWEKFINAIKDNLSNQRVELTR